MNQHMYATTHRHSLSLIVKVQDIQHFILDHTILHVCVWGVCVI